MKLSHRLAALQSIVLAAQEESPYNHIWDCCCDHGYLGISLLNALMLNKGRIKPSQIHFVDIVSHLIEQLNESLNTYTLDNEKTNLGPLTLWQTHCLDTRDIPLNQHQGKHLVIIAGVGGVQTQEFIQQLCNNNPNQAFDVLLCPVHQLYPLRSTLNTQGFSLIEERLIKENKRYYEVIHASYPYAAGKTNITSTGDKIWQSHSKEEKIITKEYLHKLIQHYQKMLKGKLPDSDEHTEIQNILRDYQRLL